MLPAPNAATFTECKITTKPKLKRRSLGSDVRAMAVVRLFAVRSGQMRMQERRSTRAGQSIRGYGSDDSEP